MRRLYFLVLFLLLASALMPGGAARAGVISRDWKTPGDGLLTYDDVNRREWLDLTQTLLNQFPGNTSQQQFHNVLAELEPSGIFDGFTHATADDVIDLAQSAGIDTSTLNFATNNIPTQTIIHLISATATFSRNREFSQFLVNDMSAAGLRAEFFTNPVSGLDGHSGFVSSNSLDDVGPRGVMLYRQTVPEPSQFVMLLFLILSSRSARYRSLYSVLQSRWLEIP